LAEILIQNPILLLFVVASLGYLLGSIKIGKSSLGVAAVLFTGLAFGAYNPNFQIPEIILQLGLCIFVYSIGLSSGPAFFQSYKKNGLRDFSFILSALILTGSIAAVISIIFDFSAATITGAYSGSSTNTPALAGVIDYINNTYKNTEQAATLVQDTVVGYSFSYPMGVLGGIIAILVMERVFKIDYNEEKKKLRHLYPVDDELSSASVKITNEAVCNIPLRDLFKQQKWNVMFGRMLHNEEVSLANWNTQLMIGDEIMLIGAPEDLEKAVSYLGVKSNAKLSYDRRLFDVRRIFVSNAALVGQSIASLNLDEKYNAIITRIRRGDIDMLAKGNTVLELGDRIRFIAKRTDLKELSAYFGDSYHASSKVNLFSFGLGIGLGLILGNITISLSPDFSFKLGYAGGPLIVGLILGALRRTGKIVWTMPYSANVTLQQIGLILLLVTIGVRSGNAFVQSFSIEGLWIFFISVILSLFAAFTMLIFGYKLFKIPFSILMGMVANQPAILDFAASRTNNRIPQIGYAMMFPIALIAKIIIAQLLFIILQ